MDNETPSIKEQRIRKITQLYYSQPEIKKALMDFSVNREVCPRYFEGFGKRPDTFQYESDVFELVKRGATSFHCSQEIWSDVFKIQTGMSEKQFNEIRTGWDLLIDIDSKYIDYSKICAQLIISVLEFHGVRNFGIKFSGSKGFHLIIPWKSFPKEINGEKTSDKFPEIPRIITKYIMEKIKNKLIEEISSLSKPNKYIKDFQAPKEVMPDLVLVSSRHLFRMPYSLHEKTALASVVLNKKELSEFQLKDADPFKIKIKEFIPDSVDGEASELLMQALDWSRDNTSNEEKKIIEFRPIQITDRSEKNFPVCIKEILKGMNDGKKRGVFVLINFLRSIGTDKDELEKIIYSWNEKNKPPLHKGYIKTQISWAFRKKSILPPNCAEFYHGLGVCTPDSLCAKVKNPVNYVVKKNLFLNRHSSKIKDNFKNNS